MEKAKDLKVEYKAREKLIPYVHNPRTHSDWQVKQIASSIKEFGFTNPILIDEDNGVIAGHGRLLAAELLELAKVPTITLTGLTDIQRKAYIIADNRLAMNAGWDMDFLRQEMQMIADEAFNLDLLGFSDSEIADILDMDVDLEVDPVFDYALNVNFIIRCETIAQREELKESLGFNKDIVTYEEYCEAVNSGNGAEDQESDRRAHEELHTDQAAAN